MIINVYWSSSKEPVIRFRFSRSTHFRDRFSKNTQIPNFIKGLSVKADLFHADQLTEVHTDRQIDGRTDMTKLIVAFCILRTRLYRNGKEIWTLKLRETCTVLEISVLWDVTKHWWVVIYRRFGTNYRSHLQRFSNPRRLLDPYRQFLYVVPKLRQLTSIRAKIPFIQRQMSEITQNYEAQLPLGYKYL